MRIMIIHPHLDTLGGSEILTSILMRELVSFGHELVVVTRARRIDLFPDRSKVRYVYFRKVSKTDDVVFDNIRSIMSTMHQAFSKYRPDVVLIMIQEPIYALVSKLLKPSLGAAMYIHFPYEEELTLEKIHIFLKMYRFPGRYERLYHIADLHMTNSAYTARTLHINFRIESNIVYPAIFWDYYEEEPTLTRIPDPNIISVGRFVPHKRLDVLIKMFKDVVKKEVPEAELTIVGIPDPRYREYYEKVKELAESVKDVTLIDRALKPKELIEIYRSARDYVHMRVGEHFGMAPLEAMSQGAVPIVPKQSGFAEVIKHGISGYTYESDDECVKYIIEVLKKSKSSYYKMRRRVYVRSLLFMPDRFAAEVDGYLRILLH
ncbi:MAG: glycosyltransferase family 4 protein [Desulfurococcales archaeon]|nr:glycosyltransferase family 4 protein [Desulfurococcales archaeon]